MAHYFTDIQTQLILQYTSLSTDESESFYTKNIYPILENLIKHILSDKRYYYVYDKDELTIDLLYFLYYKQILYKYKDGGNMFSFLTQCIKNEIMQINMKKNRDFNNLMNNYDNYITECLNNINEDEYEDLDDIRLKQIDNSIWCLKDYELIIYQMYFIEQKTMKKISDELNVNLNYIKKYITNIRLKIREQLELTEPLHKIGKVKKTKNKIYK